MFKPDDSQERAINNIINSTSKVSILTAGGGYGKTTCVQIIVQRLWEEKGINPEKTFFCAPTGRAAYVLDQSLTIPLKEKPQTMHRLLKCRGYEWEYNRNNQLDAELIIADEQSMTDSELMARLFYSVSDGCRFILIGDFRQLNPVGPGCPFGDIVRKDDPETVFKLEVNHRQKAGELIANCCESVLAGDFPIFGVDGGHTLGGETEDNAFFHETEDKEDVKEKLLSIVEEWHNSGSDYIIISPQHKGDIGVEAINDFLQEALNPYSPDKPEIMIYGKPLRLGDKCKHTKNNYKLNIFNGFIGVVVGVSNGMVVVDYDGKIIHYEEQSDIDELIVCYCTTFHGVQGAQYNNVAMVVHSSHYYCLSNSLMYVGVSRAQKLLHIVGNMKGVKRAIGNMSSSSRNTYLDLKFKGGVDF